MNKESLKELNGFLGRASKVTYAGGGAEAESRLTGFKELEYRESDWYYCDSYCGSLRSWGREVVWQDDKPVWTCLYGGGMTKNHLDQEFATKTFGFLKKALSTGDKENIFQPRGPEAFSDGGWSYQCKMEGTIDKFKGHESISYGGETVFTHDFFGGTVITS
ncbi:MAG TPA: DUF5680 domain-containing protein [Candidatus Saccharimonadales bacterium]|nr:DUF5680 domain-containing protein [Candidatus Saccharimonadales bacterium]